MNVRHGLRITDSPRAERFDLLVVAHGYEERSVHIAQRMGPISDRKLALSFRSDQTLCYGTNRTILENGGFRIVPLESEAGRQVAEAIDRLPDGHRTVGIDISSFTRFQLAQIVEAVVEPPSCSLSVDFLYAPAKSEDWINKSGPITVAEPIHPAFTSWTDDPARPLSALIGVGVEDNLALGVAEFLDVSSVYAFVPVGGDPGFDSLNSRANHQFLGTSYVASRANYDILRPFELFARLESLVYGIAPDTRVAIAPLGPKIFALCGLLVTAVLDRAATVWRFSWSGADQPANRVAAGPVASLRIEQVKRL